MKKHHAAKRLNRSMSGNIIIALFLFVFGAFMIVPFIYAISNSLKPLDELWLFPPNFFVRNPTYKNFQDLFALLSNSRVPVTRYAFNTIFISVVGTAGNLLLSSLCAYALAKHRFPGKETMFRVIVLSLMFTGTVTSIPQFLIIAKLNLLNTYAAILLPTFASSLGLYLMKQFMEQLVPDSVLESARIDGASEFRIYLQIVMPMVKPAWLTLMILSFQSLWNIGSNTLIQREELKTLNYAISQIHAGGMARAGAASAGTVLMMSVPILLFVLSQRQVIETMATSGLKE